MGHILGYKTGTRRRGWYIYFFFAKNRLNNVIKLDPDFHSKAQKHQQQKKIQFIYFAAI